MRVAFKTFGCKANSVDTDLLHSEAKKRGLEIVNEDTVADAYIINSCTVTSGADRDARNDVFKFKRLNPKALVGVIGCYAQVSKDELLSISQVDFVLGTANKQKILDHLVDSWKNVPVARDQVDTPTGFLQTEFQGSRRARASIKIQDGCNFSCSFCIIPQARGRSRSLPIQSVLDQIDQAYHEGFNEVVLTGIHLAHYGWDNGTDLITLLNKAIEKKKGPRIRISTLDPFEVPDELIALMANEPRICNHLHIALQSGSDKVLSGMRRIYKAQEFIDVTNKIAAQVPNTFIGVDVIVGFHGETEDDFQQTIDCLNKSYWTKLHVFPFSVRKDTRAETMEGAVPAATIAERSRILREMSDKKLESFLDSQIGTDAEIILERPTHQDPNVWQGHTKNYIQTLTKIDSGKPKHLITQQLRLRENQRLATS